MMLWALAALCALGLAQAASFGFDRSTNVGFARALQLRQDAPDVPGACQSTCNPINSAIAAGCTFEGCCTSQFETGYFNCFKCVAQAVGVTDFTLPQQTVDALLEECGERGFAIPKLTFPGQNPDRPLTTLPITTPQSTVATSTTIAAPTTINSRSSSASAPTSSPQQPSAPSFSVTQSNISTLSLPSTSPTSTLQVTGPSTSTVSASSAAQSASTALTPSASSSSSSANPAQSSQSSGASERTVHPVLVVFSIFLLGVPLL